MNAARRPRLALPCSAFIASQVALFGVLHFQSVGWASAQIVDRARGYFRALSALGLTRVELLAPPSSPNGRIHALLFAAALLLQAVAYVWLVLRLRAREDAGAPLRDRDLLALTLACALPLGLSPLLLSGDVWSYIAFGRIAAVHGANPYFVAPEAFPDDPFNQWVYWQKMVAPYGPVWIGVAGAIARGATMLGLGPGGHVLAFRLLAVAAHLASGVLLLRLLDSIAPPRRTSTTAAYLLHPLCLLEFAGGAHNDALLIALLLAGLLQRERGRFGAAVLLATLASLVKIYALPVLGLIALAGVLGSASPRERVRAGAMAAGVFIVTTVALYAPFWEGAGTLAFLRDVSQRRVLNSLAEFVATDVLHLSIGDDAQAGSPAFFRFLAAWRIASMLLVAAFCLRFAARARSTAAIAGGAATCALLFCTLAATWYWPWYATSAVALAAVSGARYRLQPAILLALLSMSIYLPKAFGWPGGDAIARALFSARALPIVVPPLILALRLALRRAGADQGEAGAP